STGNAPSPRTPRPVGGQSTFAIKSVPGVALDLMSTSHVRPAGNSSARLQPAFTALERGERDGAIELLGRDDLTDEERVLVSCRLAEAFETAGLFDDGLALLRPFE